MPPSRLLVCIAALTLAGTLTACGKDDTASAESFSVKAGDDSCELEQTSFDAGKLTFDVENTGSDVTEVYVYGKDGADFTKIMGEVENIGPGTSRDLDVDLAAGEYQVACKPGMRGDGIRTDITVSGSGGTAADRSEGAYDRELEFEVGADGSVTAPKGALTAQSGERIEFKLENDSSNEYYLELVDPSGEDLEEAEAGGESDAEFVAELPGPGTYTVKVFADGHEDRAVTKTLVVK